MTNLTRRVFLGQLTTSPLFTLTVNAAPERTTDEPVAAPPAEVSFPAAIPGKWRAFGRLLLQKNRDSVTLQDGFTVEEQVWKDGVFTLRARASKEAEQVQIWAGARCRDRESRYVFALRGGDNDDMYLARYAPDGAARFLGIAPLDFSPERDTWYTLRLITRGNRFQLFLNDEKTPRIDVVDKDALWTEGGVSLGGGWLPVEFRDVSARALTDTEIAAIDAIPPPNPRAQPPADPHRETKRKAQRAAYKPQNIDTLAGPHVEVSLEGGWLFLPDQEKEEGVEPESPGLDDQSWHIMDVPHFWTPTLTWLHAETGFPELPGVSTTKGICDKLYGAEMSRLDGYTFPWRDTRSAWYRHHIDLPADAADLAGRRFALRFDAIAKIAEIWVNGIRVGSHVGMFGEVNCDITKAVRPGANVIVLHVTGRTERGAASNKVLGVAVTVEVTAAMLNSLPHGMYPNEAGGIWQPVTLIVTGPTTLDDIYIKPRLDGLDCELTIGHAPDTTPGPVSIAYIIRAKKGGDLLYESPSPGTPEMPGTDGLFHFSTPKLTPDLWSPADPNLYELEVTLFAGGQAQDRRTVSFGFRTFGVENGKLSLNGRPFWLRGGNHFPHALRPNDLTLARKFMAMAKDGSIVATRSHTAPFSKTWLRAADEAGILVSFEGTWPWLMLRGEPPAPDLLQAWQSEFEGMIRTHRNHPSLAIWTVNNEMKFPGTDRKTPDLLRRKWIILDGMMKAIRAADPTRPIVCDSSYVRAEVAKEYDDLIKPSGFDDGDIDDIHRYYGWYDQTFFHLDPRISPDGGFSKRIKTPGRPLISQEMSTGYARNDDGHPCRFYLFKHYTPQTFVGDEAWENRDPAHFLNRQAFLLGELAESFRRYGRQDVDGMLHFAYLTWFKDVWNAGKIGTFPPYHALQRALRPVMVSAELYGRHLFAGENRPIRICIANDDQNGSDLPAARLVWELHAEGKAIANGSVSTPAVPYYANAWIKIDLGIPRDLPAPRTEAVLTLRLANGDTLLSENAYDLTLATSEWAGVFRQVEQKAFVYRPGQSALFPLDRVLVVEQAEAALRDTDTAKRLRAFLTAGGRAILLHPGAVLSTLFPEQVKGYRACTGEIATMHIPESPVFNSLAPLDLAWFEQGEGRLPRACRGVYRIDRSRRDVAALVDVVDRHGYLQKPGDFAALSGHPLVEIRAGRGLVIASEMLLEAADRDPIAKRLYSNLLAYLT